MPKLRARVRVLILLVAIAAVVFGAWRRRNDRMMRADLLRRAEKCEEYALILRTVPTSIAQADRLTHIHLYEDRWGFSRSGTAEAPGLTRAEAAKEFDLKAAEYARLASVYRRAAKSRWVRSAPPIPPYVYQPAPQIREPR